MFYSTEIVFAVRVKAVAERGKPSDVLEDVDGGKWPERDDAACYHNSAAGECLAEPIIQGFDPLRTRHRMIDLTRGKIRPFAIVHDSVPFCSGGGGKGGGRERGQLPEWLD